MIEFKWSEDIVAELGLTKQEMSAATKAYGADADFGIWAEQFLHFEL